MNPQIARSFAYSRHLDQRDRSGGLLVEHLQRVAAAVPPNARAVAFLHDVLERTDTSVRELEQQGLTRSEVGAVELLTRSEDESFEAHALRIAHAKGPAGRLARTVKLADMADHVQNDRVDMPTRPYGWAQRHIAFAQLRTESPVTILPSARRAAQGLPGTMAAGEAPA